MITTDEPLPVLDDQLCFDLYTASQAITEAYRPSLGKLGLTYPQYLVLLALWERGTMGIDELGDLLHLDQADLNLVLLRMTGNRHVEKGVTPDGVATVVATDQADALRPEITRIHCEIKDLLGLDAAAFRALQHTLRTVTRLTRST